MESRVDEIEKAARQLEEIRAVIRQQIMTLKNFKKLHWIQISTKLNISRSCIREFLRGGIIETETLRKMIIGLEDGDITQTAKFNLIYGEKAYAFIKNINRRER